MVSCQLSRRANNLHARLTTDIYARWEEINLAEATPALAFYGLRNTAWPGHIRLQNTAGEWQIVISPWGRIRLCKPTQVESCR